MKTALLGYGVVGKAFEKLASLNGIEITHVLRRNENQLEKPVMTTDFNDILNDRETETVVECMGGLHPAYDYVSASLKAGKHVITANKKMLAHYYKELTDTAGENGVKLLFSASCGGGIPWIKELKDISESDMVHSFRGIMNGTSNYILDKMGSESSPFKDALKKAQELGYAEADPSDDIDGVDTANKVILSAGVAFKIAFSPEEMFVRGIRNIALKDMEFALKHDCRIVLLGKGVRNAETYTLSVMPTMVSRETVLGNIKANYNCFILDSDNLQGLTLIGQGAGGIPTASNILRDVLSLDTEGTLTLEGSETINYGNNPSRFYLRTEDKPEDKYIDKTISEDTYLLKKMDIDTLRKIINKEAFVMEVSD